MDERGIVSYRKVGSQREGNHIFHVATMTEAAATATTRAEQTVASRLGKLIFSLCHAVLDSRLSSFFCLSAGGLFLFVRPRWGHREGDLLIGACKYVSHGIDARTSPVVAGAALGLFGSLAKPKTNRNSK